MIENPFLRPLGDGNYHLYVNGSDSWHIIGTVEACEDGFAAWFRCKEVPRDEIGRNVFDSGLHETREEAALALIEAFKQEGVIVREQIAYERAHGWSTD